MLEVASRHCNLTKNDADVGWWLYSVTIAIQGDLFVQSHGLSDGVAK
jgi:hypothetical protein